MERASSEILRRFRAQALIAVLALTLLGGCILLVHEPAHGTSCTFEGAASACGACVRERCRSSLDACCGDDGCAETLNALDGCASRSDLSCVALASAARAPRPTSANLAACIEERCAGLCQPREGTSESACKELPLAPGVSCSCMTSATPNDFTCSEAVQPGTRCCAPKGWPAAGLQCACRQVSCNPTPDGCFCSLVDYTPEQTACTGVFCCVKPGQDDECACRSRACFADEQRVATCSVATVGCGPQVRHGACSLRGP